MRKLVATTVLTLCLAIAYAAAPFVTAWNIREAIKSGDAAYLSGKVDWPRVRETLKQSLAVTALDLPSGTSPGTEPERKPSLWQRFKTWAGKGAVDRMVETYANAEGLPQLFSWRSTYRSATGYTEEPKTLSNLPDRIKKAWVRVKRAEFVTATRFEMEMEDKHEPDRSYAGTLELVGFEWKLVSLHVRQEKQNSLTGSPAPTSGGLFARLKSATTKRLAQREDRGDPMER